MPEPTGPADQRREIVPSDGLWRWLQTNQKLLERGVTAVESIAETLKQLAPERREGND